MYRIVMFLAVLVSLCTMAPAQVSITTTSNGRVQLHWMPDTNVRRTFLVYRRGYTDATYPREPLMRVSVATCQQITDALKADTSLAALVRSVVVTTPAPMTEQVLAARICDVLRGDVTTSTYRLLARIAKHHYKLAALMGSYVEDGSTRAQTQYTYDVRIVVNFGEEMSIMGASSSLITAGQASAIATPGNVAAEPMDGAAQILWSQPLTGAPYIVYLERSLSQQNWQRATVTEVIGVITPESINGVQQIGSVVSTIDDYDGRGLQGGRQYFYRVRFQGAGQANGQYSQIVSVRPYDSTAPATPQQISAEETPGQHVRVRWNRVYLDTKGRPELVSSYRVYRMSSTSASVRQAELIATVQVSVQDTATRMYDVLDARPPYDSCRNVSVSYFVRAVDGSSNESMQSATTSTILRDIIPPERIKEFTTSSLNWYIDLNWRSNGDCGVKQFNIYRALCDFGKWYPCPSDGYENATSTYIGAITKSTASPRTMLTGADSTTPTCGGPFMLVGTVKHDERVSIYSFRDNTVPSGSPLCYAYMISVQDSSGNQSVAFPIPNPALDRVVCAALSDHTPPMAASITDVVIGDNSARIEVTTAPVQDLAGYHLYRRLDSTKSYEFRSALIYNTITGKFAQSATKHEGNSTTPVSCDVIPLDATRQLMRGAFDDDSLMDHTRYYYAVTTVDRHGNESSLQVAHDISTFTFGRSLLPEVRINSIQPSSDGGSLEVQMSTVGRGKNVARYVLYRATSEQGTYQQIGNAQTTGLVTDDSARRSRVYWYKAMVVFDDRTYSNLSAPVRGELP